MVRLNDQQEPIFNAVKSKLEDKATGIKLSDAAVFRSTLLHMAADLGIETEPIQETEVPA
jgi:hypothetical protein